MCWFQHMLISTTLPFSSSTKAHSEHIVETWKCDNGDSILNVAPKLSKAHIAPNGFKKIRVDLAFQVFSQQTLNAFDFYEEDILRQYPNLNATKNFVELMMNLIKVVTTRFHKEALR